jgi:hypothetical protein
MDWIDLVQFRDQRRVLVNTVIWTFGKHEMLGKYLGDERLAAFQEVRQSSPSWSFVSYLTYMGLYFIIWRGIRCESVLRLYSHSCTNCLYNFLLRLGYLWRYILGEFPHCWFRLVKYITFEFSWQLLSANLAPRRQNVALVWAYLYRIFRTFQLGSLFLLCLKALEIYEAEYQQHLLSLFMYAFISPPYYAFNQILGQLRSPQLKNWTNDNVLPDQDYRSAQRAMIDEYGALVKGWLRWKEKGTLGLILHRPWVLREITRVEPGARREKPLPNRIIQL